MAGSLVGCRWRFLAGIVAGVLLFGATGSAQAQGGPSTCLPGAAGIGDAYFPTYGNGGYNVGHYDLNVAYEPGSGEPGTGHLEGRARIRATASQSLCSFNLDLVGLDVRGIEVDDQEATWTRSGQELVVTPNAPLAAGQRFDAVVRYSGVPSEFVIPGTTLRTGFMPTPEGATVAGQPEVAAGWYPVNDHPLDKASYSFDITVPDAYEVAANGFLQGTADRGNRTLWRWEAREPMASYLATIDIADWDVNEYETADGLPVYDAVSSNIGPNLRAEIDKALAKQGDVLELLSEAFGPYPFDTTGAIVPNQEDLRFALETQTRPVYSKRFWGSEASPRNADFVVVHELAHQWYGDDVALARWQDIWLNEGFASYAEWLWEEREGRGTPQQIFQATYNSIPETDPFWSVVIGDPTVPLLFHDAVYVRGAMTLQALRNEVGDDAFFEILRQWASNKSGGNGTTPEFIQLVKDISDVPDEQLDDLFNTWLFTGERPPPSATEPAAAAAARATTSRQASDYAASWLRQVHKRLRHGGY